MVRTCSRLTTDAALKVVPALLDRYEQGGAWLERRLDDVAAGRGRILGIPIANRLAALAIETPKGAACRKLSTFGVAPDRRSLGLGAALIEALRRSWIDQGVEHAYVTVDHMDLQTHRFFLKHGFVDAPEVRIRYGVDRFDCLMTWSPSSDPLIAAPLH